MWMIKVEDKFFNGFSGFSSTPLIQTDIKFSPNQGVVFTDNAECVETLVALQKAGLQTTLLALEEK